MITRWTAWWRRLRRAISRTEWSVRWLRLPRTRCVPTDHGIIFIQIDGLSRDQLQQAMEQGRMPFLSSLVQREHYQLHSLYSGLPSSTPSVQGELFYGPRCAVPAFGFRDHRTGKLAKMFSREVARDVQDRLQQQGEGLLTDGSSYCNIYGGGAAETHFCASSFGWDEMLQSVNPIKLATVLVFHAWSFVRTLTLLVIELFLGILGFLRGAMSGRELWQELMMIPARVVVVILMRELSTIGATMDAARGLPVIHLNLLGYDEQAHRRGPGSAFAHWTLKGIDAAIRRLWDSAHRSARRHYDLWVYSDHGQEHTTPYQYLAGQPIQEIVAEVVRDHLNGSVSQTPVTKHDEAPTRAQWLSAGWIVGELFGEDPRDVQPTEEGVQVAAIGPLGLVYIDRSLSTHERIMLAEILVRERKIPLACVATDPGLATAITPDGQFVLPRQYAEVFASHPFAEEVAADLVRLCHHPDAGEFVVSGWNRDGSNCSFVLQSGAHAGPGPCETGAFALLPCDAPLPAPAATYLRAGDLREAARTFLHRASNVSGAAASRASSRMLRIMTYNVHSCVGMDRQLSPARIARVIAQSGADVVCLQELDVFRDRTGYRDQAQDIARHLEMQCHFHPALQLEEEKYGDAVLSRYPIHIVKTGSLPATKEHREPRGAIWVEVILDEETRIQLLNTHLSIYPNERVLQAKALVTDQWIGAATQRGPTVVCGDFNAHPASPSYRTLASRLRDVQTSDTRQPTTNTWFSPRPLARIDHIFTTDDLTVLGTQVIQSRLAAVASDHLPLVADLCLVVEKWPDPTRSFPRSSGDSH